MRRRLEEWPEDADVNQCAGCEELREKISAILNREAEYTYHADKDDFYRLIRELEDLIK